MAKTGKIKNMNPLRTLIFSALLITGAFLPLPSSAQELIQDKVEIVKAKVVEVVSQEKKEVPGTYVQSTYQTIRAEILEGDKKGEVVTIENDLLVLEKGDKFFLRHSIDGLDGREMYAVRDIDRRGVILGFIILFAVVVMVFSGKQGLRSLMSLAGSFFVILYILVPSLLKGYPPVLTSIAIAAVILFLAIFFVVKLTSEPKVPAVVPTNLLD